jgi:glycosyltransferase involved in cell wall biosynthesis
MERGPFAESMPAAGLALEEMPQDLPLSLSRTAVPPRVSVVIASLNEEVSLPHVLSCMPPGVFEVILVDGHSTDRTVETARRLLPEIRVVHQRGKGKGDALRCGFEAARGDLIVALDADGSTDPREIPAFVGALLAGADFVKGSRFIPGAGTGDMTLTRKAGNKGLVYLVWLLFGTRYTDLCYGYTAFWRRCLPALDLRSDGFEIETEMNVRAAVARLKVVEVASFERNRIGGEPHLRPFADGWRVLMEILGQRRRASKDSASRRTHLSGIEARDEGRA